MKFIKSLIITVTILSLSGCMWQTIDEVDTYYAKMLCAENGSSLDSISEYAIRVAEVKCKGSYNWYDLEYYKGTVLSRGVENNE